MNTPFSLWSEIKSTQCFQINNAAFTRVVLETAQQSPLFRNFVIKHPTTFNVIVLLRIQQGPLRYGPCCGSAPAVMPPLIRVNKRLQPSDVFALCKMQIRRDKARWRSTLTFIDANPRWHVPGSDRPAAAGWVNKYLPIFWASKPKTSLGTA